MERIVTSRKLWPTFEKFNQLLQKLAAISSPFAETLVMELVKKSPSHPVRFQTTRRIPRTLKKLNERFGVTGHPGADERPGGQEVEELHRVVVLRRVGGDGVAGRSAARSVVDP